jgi:hypothetical protein
MFVIGCAVAEAVSHRLSPAAARRRSRFKSYTICGGQSGTLAGFLLALQFPLPLIHSTKPEGKRPLGRPKRRWIGNIKKDLLEIGVSVVDCIGLAQDRYRWRALVNSVMNLRVP